MPERIFALFANTPDQRERIQQMFLDAGMIDELVQPAPASLLYKVELHSEEVAARLSLAALANGVQPPLIQRFLDPTAKELAAAELLYMSVGGKGTERGHPRDGTSYDERSACKQCGAGLIQETPFRVRKTELPKSALVTGIADDVIMHDTIADLVAKEGLAGIGFREVLDQAGAPIPWRQLTVEQVMPSMLASARGFVRGRSGAERPCTLCGRDGWFDTTNDPFIPAYPRTVLETMPDVAWMHELFSTGAWQSPIHGKRSLARRRLIVRPRFYQLLKSLKVRGLRFSPVRVE